MLSFLVKNTLIFLNLNWLVSQGRVCTTCLYVIQPEDCIIKFWHSNQQGHSKGCVGLPSHTTWDLTWIPGEPPHPPQTQMVAALSFYPNILAHIAICHFPFSFPNFVLSINYTLGVGRRNNVEQLIVVCNFLQK